MMSRLQSPGRRQAPSPLALLAVLTLLSLAVRVAWLGEPCHSPCRTASDHVLIFDESYYVNAARVIAGERPPAGAAYAGAPLGDDPNSEHPQLAKVIMAGSIELFGDGPLAWRLGSVLAGSIAILGVFWLTRAAGGGEWMALGAAALMATDNLLLVHGRIGTLDIYALAAMIWGVVLYLRGRPILAGAVIGVGACAKLVAPYALVVLAVLEGLRWLRSRSAASTAAWRLARCAAAAGGVLIGLLALLDRLAPPYDPVAGKRVGGGVLGHLGHMLHYAAQQTSPHGPKGIASYPWEWLGDYKPITYLNVNPARPGDGLYHVHPAVHFLGLISPPILLAALPALALAAWRTARGARHASNGARPRGALPSPGGEDEVGLLALAWFVGTFVPFELASLLLSRTSYLYYMVIVMPGLYLAAAQLMATIRRHWVTAAWIGAVVVAAIVMYPLTPLP